MRISTIPAFLLMAFASSGIQPQQPKTLTGMLTMKSNSRTTAVHGKSKESGQEQFLFCIDHAASSPQRLEFTGQGRVVYRPVPLDLPEGVEISGPENVASTLAVVAEDGRAWLFVANGEKPLLQPGDPALAKATTVNVRLVRRTDWAAKQGPRRGTDMEGCLAAGG